MWTMNDMEVFTLSICIITYNQEKFIKQTLDGVFSQKFDFNVELIISNDNSTDSTHEIINNYLFTITIPDNIKIKYVTHKKNIGAIPNFKWTLKQAKGKYIAICEGDDYWTDVFKLKKQVDFLDKNINFSSCFTDIDVLLKGELNNNALKQKHKKNHDLLSLQIDQWIPTLTIVFRKECIKDLSNKIVEVLNGDVFLFHHLANKGTIAYLDFNSGVYRIQAAGIWSSLNVIKQIESRINTLKVLKKVFPDKELIKLIDLNLNKAKKTKRKIYFQNFKHIFASSKIYKLLKSI